jgi:hypothetical protein
MVLRAIGVLNPSSPGPEETPALRFSGTGRYVADVGDRPRLLASRSEQGYTSSAIEALPAEPEAVSEEEQASITRAVRQGEQERLRREWRRTRATINGELDRLSAAVSLDPGARSGVRAVRRSTDALGRRLGFG